MFAEIGVWKGTFHRALLRGLTDKGYFARGFAIDSWEPSKHHPGGITEYFTRTWEQIRDGISIPLKMQSTLASTLFPGKCFDLVYIDADHRYLGISEDIQAWEGTVAPGGLLCGHDYGMVNPRGKECGVRKAVDEYIKRTGYTLELGDYSTWHIQIPS